MEFENNSWKTFHSPSQESVDLANHGAKYAYDVDEKIAFNG